MFEYEFGPADRQPGVASLTESLMRSVITVVHMHVYTTASWRNRLILDLLSWYVKALTVHTSLSSLLGILSTDTLEPLLGCSVYCCNSQQLTVPLRTLRMFQFSIQ